ncbi:hypothetical protein DH2020_022240 [Rehmannia glutinosa]|uniref:BED-type domain-containing protein n=1 Tax=Rehmannia glutinosa TaxID=99300 RepID=A0ABR0WH07_REHGL
MVRKKDPFWEYVDPLDGRFVCKFCGRNFPGGVPRIKSHLSGITGRDIDICANVPDDVQAKAFLAIGVPGIYKKKDKDEVDKKLAKFFTLNNIAFNVVQKESFKEFLRAIMDYGPSYKIPSYSILRTKLIPDVKKDVEHYVAEVSKEKKTGTYLRDILITVVEDIGPQHVTQFITDNASNFESAGDMLMGKYIHLYKTRCAAHGIQLLLKDIYGEVEWVRNVIDDAKLIVTYMYKHTIILSLMREHTNNKELKHPCATRFASNFKMLESVLNVEDELRVFVASSTWRGLEYSKQAMAKNVTSIIQRSEFWKQGKEVLHALEPLVRVLRLVDGEGSTSAYLYEAMERAKEAIKQNCHHNQSKYMQIWTLFEVRRSNNIIHPVHAAAAFLNPAYMRSENFREDKEIKEGIAYVLENLVSPDEKSGFLKELQLYRMKPSSLFTSTAISMLKTSHPRVWWDFCGDSLPILRKYAIRILSQPCSSSPCERNWSAWEAAQTKKRNRLTPEMLDTLVYVRMNTMMMEKFDVLKAKDLEPIDLDHLDELPNYVDHDQDEDGDLSDATNTLVPCDDDLTWLDDIGHTSSIQ